MLLTLYVVISYTFLEINTFSADYTDGNSETTKLPQNTSNSINIVEDANFIPIILNTIKAPNLKYNIFDKMLSNEMLSIKHHLFDKNSTHASSVYISLQSNVPTPTLVLKQKWPIDKLVLKSEPRSSDEITSQYKQNYFTGYSSTVMVSTELDSENKNTDYTKNKVIEVRSFSNMPVYHTKAPSILRQKPTCTCMKTNQDTTCSQHCTATEDCSRTKKVCTHTDEYKTCQSECTRTTLNNIMSNTLFPYYPSYFLGIPTVSPNIYYHPNVINELKIPKHKHRHTNKPYNYLVEENGDQVKEENYYYEENEKTDYLVPSVIEYENEKYGKYKHKHKSNKIEAYDLDNDKIEVMDKDRFIDEVVEDLKTYYSDAVIKDCYCSLSTFNLKIHHNFIILFTFVIIVIM